MLLESCELLPVSTMARVTASVTEASTDPPRAALRTRLPLLVDGVVAEAEVAVVSWGMGTTCAVPCRGFICSVADVDICGVV